MTNRWPNAQRGWRSNIAKHVCAEGRATLARDQLHERRGTTLCLIRGAAPLPHRRGNRAIGCLIEKCYISPQAGFIALLPQLLDDESRPAAMALLKNLTVKYPKVAEAHYALAQTALAADHAALALTSAQRAVEFRPIGRWRELCWRAPSRPMDNMTRRWQRWTNCSNKIPPPNLVFNMRIFCLRPERKRTRVASWRS